MARKKLVVISSRIPWPLDKGDKLRLYHQIKVLATRYEVHLLAICHQTLNADQLWPLKSICTSIRLYPLGRLRRYCNMITTRRIPLQVSYLYDKIIHQEILHTLDMIEADLVYCQLIRTAAFAKGINTPVILDYMDSGGLNDLAAHYQSNLFMRLLLMGETRRVVKYEQTIAYLFNEHTIISARDQLTIDTPLRQHLTLVTNGVVTDELKANEPTGPPSTVGFVGNLSYRHNQMAIDFILDKLLPLLDPSIKIILVGAGRYSRLEHFEHPQVKFLGYVDKLETIYAQMTVALAPIFSGSGIQNKVLEAMAHRTPVIATSFVRAAFLAVENNILYADDARGFVAHLNDLLSHPDKAASIAQKAHAYVVKEYNWSKVTQPLIRLIEKHLNERIQT